MALIWFALAFAVFAQTPQPGSRFDITGYAVEGSPLLKNDDFSRIIAPFIGKQKSAADVQKAQQTLQQAYFDLGHCSVQVTVPRTDPVAGVITFRLVQTPAPLSRDCLPMVVLDDKRGAPPVTVGPGEVAVRPFADASGTVPESAPSAGRPEIARATVKPLQDSPTSKPLQDRPAGVTPVPKPAIAAAPAPGEEAVANVMVKPLAEVPAPQPGLVASTDFPAPPPAAKPQVSAVPVTPPAAVAVAPAMPQLEPKPAIAAPVAPSTLKLEAPPVTVAIAPPIAPAPKVESVPVPSPVVSESAKPAVVKPELAPVAPAPVPVVPPVAIVVSPPPAPKIEVPPVAAAIIPPAMTTELKPAEIPAAPAIAVPQVEPMAEPKPVPPPVVSEPAKPAVLKAEPAPVEPPIAVVSPPPAPKIEVPPVAAAITPPAATTDLKPSEVPAAPVITVPQVKPITEPKPVPPPVAVAIAPPIAPAPKVESAPAPPPVVSEPAKPAVVKAEPAPAAPPVAVVSPPPVPKIEVPPVAPAIAPPAVTTELKSAEVPVAPAIAVPQVEPIAESKPVPPPVAVAIAPPIAPAPKIESAPAPPPVVSEPAKPAVVKAEPAPVATEPSPAPKVEIPPVAVAIAPPPAAMVETPKPIETPTVPLVAAPEVKTPVAEKPIEKPAPTVVAATPVTPDPVRPEPKPVVVEPEPAPPPVVVPAAPKPESVSPIAVLPAQPAPMADAPKAVTEEKVASPSAPKPVAATAPDEVAAASTPTPAVKSVPSMAVESKPEPSIAVAAAPVTTPKVEAKSAEKPVPAPAAAPEVTVRPFTDPAAKVVEAPEPAEIQPEITRAPVRPLQDRPPVSPAEKPAVASAPAPAAEPKPATASAAKPAATKPEPAPPSRIAEATPGSAAPAAKQPSPKPAPLFVHAPPESLKSATPDVSAQSTTADGSPAVAAPLKFVIERYRVLGNTVLKPETVTRVLIGYTGPQKDFGDVQRALEALQNAFQDAGYGAVQVTLPEQELDDGEVDLDVIETRLGKIDVQGNDYHDERNIRNSLPEVTEGRTPNSLAIARNLRIANENSSKQTQVALRSSSQDGEVDATIKVVDDNPIKRSVSLDNTGTYSTGKYRAGFGFQHANMFNRDHVLTLQYITSPEHPSAVTVLGLGYRVPLYKLGHSIDLIAGYSDVTSGTVAQLFNVSGAGTVFGARYNQNLDRSETYEHKIIYGIDYKAFKNNVTFLTSTLPQVPDITVHPVSITYSGLRRSADSQLDFYASYTQNIFPGGNDGANSDFQGPSPIFAGPATLFPSGSRVGAKAGYTVIRAGANYTRQVWGEWQARAVVAAQHTEHALIAGEQFGVGGADSVRGFDERAFSNDRGYRGSLELYTPDMASNFGWTGGRVKFLVFYDTANLTRNLRQGAEQDGLSLDSYGIGLRLQTKNYLTLRADYAQVKHDGGMTAGKLDGRINSNTLHTSMVLVF